jgi:ADP-ribosyl-[dinitrogen reductase] hydrolase
MLGSIAGDIIGSVYEWDRIKTTEFPLFQEKCDYTDDSVLTVATAYSILNNVSYAQSYKDFSRRYPGRGYGGNFQGWIMSDTLEPYNSWGNGSAMRVSPVGFAYDTIDEVLEHAKQSAEVTHNHPEGIKGAQATALAIFLARQGNDKETIRKETSERFNYYLNRTIDEIRPDYQFNESCQETVPEAITAFLESDDFEHSIRLAVSLGGDTDTLACITGGIAEAYYKEIPEHIKSKALAILPYEFVDILEKFTAIFKIY